jgi:hypothetical protein
MTIDNIVIGRLPIRGILQLQLSFSCVKLQESSSALSLALVNLSPSPYNKNMEEKQKQDVLVFPFPGRKEAAITIQHVDNPHGTKDNAVLAVGCTLTGATDNPTWVVHIPVSLAHDVGLALVSLSAPKRSNSVWGRGRKSLL